MTPDRYQLVKRIFATAAAAEGHDRIAVLERECGNDSELRTEVESLLAQDEKTANFLDRSLAIDPEQIWLATQQKNGRAGGDSRPDRIGQYRILNVLGEGGMGVVYLAEQDNPRRPVALKVIRPGVASESMLRRFQYEAQLLGRLHHPGIAQIYEAGMADAGCGPQPFFAMELVKGPSLRDYVAQNKLTIRQKLELLAKICDAVHHAHQKGIIHRDLKPGNILVEEDEKAHGVHAVGFAAQPKILDFGVARATEGADDAARERTMAGQLIGTISYMSPEQVAGNTDDIDIRADVYALGVIFYELLSGQQPHNLERKRLPESIRTVLEDQIKPLGAINKAFRGDLETIVGKALEKDRARRYQSALELAEDTRRFLSDRTITARPPSRVYQARKFAQRNKVMVISATLAVILAVSGLTWHVERLKAANDNLSSFDELRIEMDDPLRPAVTDERKLNSAADAADYVEDEKPATAARIHNSLGLNYMKLSQYDDARRHVSAALEIRERINAPKRELAESHHNMGRVHFYEGRLTESIAQYTIALQMRRELSNGNPFDQDVAQTMHHLASCYRKAGENQLAEQFAREALAARRHQFGGDNHSEVAAGIVSLAMIMRDQDQLEDAADLFRDAYEIAWRISIKPEEDMRVAGAMTSLADCLIDLGQWEEAANLAENSLRMKQKGYPAMHASTAQSLAVLARLRLMQNQMADAYGLSRDALQMQEATQPSNHLDIATTCGLLAEVLKRGGKYEDAAAYLERALTIRTDQLPQTHPLVGESQGALGDCLTALNRFEEAESLLLASHAIFLESCGPDHARTRTAEDRLVSLYEATGEADKAAAFKH